MLQVIAIDDVKPDEPRRYYVAKEDADASLFDRGWGAESLHTADRVAFKTAHGWTPRFAIVDRPAPTPPSAPGLDLDAVEAAERAMTPGPWPIIDPNDREPGPPVWHGSNFGGVAAIGPIHYDSDEDETQPGSPAHLRAEADSRGIVALRNAAPALIAEVRALRAKLAEAKRLADDALLIAEHEPTCAIGPDGQDADCNCRRAAIAAALEAL